MIHTKSIKASLLRRLILTTLIPIVAIGALAMSYLESRTTANIRTRNEMLAEGLIREIHDHLANALTVVEQAAGIMEDETRQDGHQAGDDSINRLLDIMVQRTGYFESICLLSREGRVLNVGYHDPKSGKRKDFIGLNLSQTRYFKQAQERQQVVWSDAFMSLLTGRLSLTLCLPAKDKLIVATFSIEKMQEMLRQMDISELMTGMIVDRKGVVLFQSESSQASSFSNIKNIAPLQLAMQGQYGATEFELDQHTWLGSVRKVDATGWHAIVMQDKADAYAPLHRLRLLFLAGVFVSVVLSLIVALALSAGLSRPLGQLVTSITDLAGGKYDAPLPVTQFRELNELSLSFRQMAHAVRAREDILNHLAAGMAGAAGRECFMKLAELMIRLLKADFATVGQLEAGHKITTRAFLLNGREEPDLTYDLKNSPCERVLTSGFCIYHCGVRAMFPKDKMLVQMGLEGYVGIPLRDRNGQVIGIINAGSRNSLEAPPQVEQILKVIAIRAEAELEREKAEQAKSEYERQIRNSQKMEAIGTLAGGIAHDFNNILGGIMGFTELAVMDLGSSNAEVLESLQQVMKSSERARDLVRQILAFSRHTEQERQRVQINPLVKEVMKLIRATIPSTIEILGELIDEPLVVQASTTQLHQVLMNLCTNAAYVLRKSGGLITVTLDAIMLDHDCARRPAKGFIPGNYARLKVTDTGPGIAPEVMDKIFDPFFTTKPQGDGTGMGLAVVHGIVQSHGGFINVTSEPGQGATFEIYLPQSIESENEDGQRHSSAPAQGRGERIMLVDDEAAIIASQSRHLTELGYQVQGFTSSVRAIQYFESDPEAFDLVITDQTMPGLTGLGLGARISRKRTSIPMIICTGYSEDVTEESCRTHGFTTILHKPVNIGRLSEAVRACLESREILRRDPVIDTPE